jgi:hypothetical protein
VKKNEALQSELTMRNILNYIIDDVRSIRHSPEKHQANYFRYDINKPHVPQLTGDVINKE